MCVKHWKETDSWHQQYNKQLLELPLQKKVCHHMKCWGMVLRGPVGWGFGGGWGGGQTCTCAGSGAALQQAQSPGGRCLPAAAPQSAAEHDCSAGGNSFQ